MGWLLACDFAEHYIERESRAWLGRRQETRPIRPSVPRLDRRRHFRPAQVQLLEGVPRFYQSWGKASNGSEAACKALSEILAFSATAGREPAWQHRRIRKYLLDAPANSRAGANQRLAD